MLVDKLFVTSCEIALPAFFQKLMQTTIDKEDNENFKEVQSCVRVMPVLLVHSWCTYQVDGHFLLFCHVGIQFFAGFES